MVKSRLCGGVQRSLWRIADKVRGQVDALVVDKVAHEAAAGARRRGAAPTARRHNAGDGHAGGERPAVKLAAPARAVGTVGAVDAADKHLQLGHEAEEAHPVCRQTHPEMCVMRVGVS